MERLAKFFDKSVTGVTDKYHKVRTTVSTITSDFSRRSKRRKQERKEKKQKKLQNKNKNNNQIDNSDIEHKYKLTCDLPNCEYHPKPNAYEGKWLAWHVSDSRNIELLDSQFSFLL